MCGIIGGNWFTSKQQTFTQLDMMSKIAPIAGVINGKLNSKIKLSGNLDAKEMTPDLKSISGDL